LKQFTDPPESTLIAVQEATFKAFLLQDMDELPVVLCSDMGTQDQKIILTTLGGLENLDGGRLNCLLVPAWTSEVEDKALLRWKLE
jgi:diphthamide biosynthesis methyltransferase